jgi:hypothetical protein
MSFWRSRNLTGIRAGERVACVLQTRQSRGEGRPVASARECSGSRDEYLFGRESCGERSTGETIPFAGQRCICVNILAATTRAGAWCSCAEIHLAGVVRAWQKSPASVWPTLGRWVPTGPGVRLGSSAVRARTITGVSGRPRRIRREMRAIACLGVPPPVAHSPDTP